MGEKKDSFRFTVQFNAGDPSHQQVAAILNEQGRRKAQFLVNAVTHYMNCPETPEAAAAPRIDRQTVEQLVREIMSNMHPEPVPAMGVDMPGCDPAITASEDIPFDAAAMLGEDGCHSLMDSLAAMKTLRSEFPTCFQVLSVRSGIAA